MANITNPSDITTQTPAVVSATLPPGASPACSPPSLLDDPFIPQVVELCRASFPGEVTVESMVDPSEPREAWLSFRVEAQGDFAAILKRERQWRQRVFELTGDRQQRYRLFVVPRE